MATPTAVVVVTGANGLVGAAVCRALVERSAQVRAVVRRAGSAPALDGVTEHVGDFAEKSLARTVTQDADAVVTTVHPMGSSRAAQHRVGAEGTPVLARAAQDAGVARLVDVSTAGVYERSAEGPRGELDSVVGVHDAAGGRPPVLDRHVERVHDEAGVLHRVAGSADDLAAESVHDAAAVDLSFAGGVFGVGSGRSAVPVSRPVRFCGPPPE